LISLTTQGQTIPFAMSQGKDGAAGERSNKREKVRMRRAGAGGEEKRGRFVFGQKKKKRKESSAASVYRGGRRRFRSAGLSRKYRP